MQNNTRKFILIPEYKPLWAMRQCFGPTHGPLEKPCPTTLDIIGQLLRQEGKEKLTVYEVLDPKTGPSDPVLLTLKNYTLPYDQIKDGKSIEDSRVDVIIKESTPVDPTVVNANKNAANTIKALLVGEKPETLTAEPEGNPDTEVSEESLPVVHGDTGATTPEQAAESLGVGDSVPVDPVVGDQLDETHTTEENQTAAKEEDESEQEEPEEPSTGTNPYAGMSRSQRRAARKAAEEASKQNN